ncbi:unnamed protein product [Peniophora sp. CBMAI 1063]|nr:unnamed protein product [Peniophora sp. CBMAI 1063]
MTDILAPSPKLDQLPAEIVILIVYQAQVTWLHEHFDAQAPYVGVKRYDAARPAPAASSGPQSCNGFRNRPDCIRSESGKVLPSHLPSPAHNASHVSKKLRYVLLANGSKIWSLDNTLYAAIARHSGEQVTTTHGVRTVEYGTRNLIALDVCNCILHGVRSFYPSLERVKIRLLDRTLTSELRRFLINNPGRADSHLREIDVESVDPDPHRVELGEWHRMAAVESDGLRSGRFYRTDIFYYSKTMTALCLQFGPNYHRVFFGESLAIGLRICAATLEFLTIDIAGGFAADLEGGETVTFPRLRHFRLCTDPGYAMILLCWMLLSHALDLHLELVESWRAAFVTKHRGILLRRNAQDKHNHA